MNHFSSCFLLRLLYENESTKDKSGELEKHFPVSILFIGFCEVWSYLHREICEVLSHPPVVSRTSKTEKTYKCISKHLYGINGPV